MGGWGSGRRRERGTVRRKDRFDVRALHREEPLQPGQSLVVGGQAVRVCWTACHFGGARPWVLCPACGERFAVLYRGRKGLACRKCLRLAYPVQRMDGVDTAGHRARKLRKRLKGPCGTLQDLFLPVFEKPKGMHIRTFLRLHEEDARLGREAFAAYVRFLGAAVRRLDIPLPPMPEGLERCKATRH